MSSRFPLLALALAASAGPLAAQSSAAVPERTDTLRLTLDQAIVRASRASDEVRLAAAQTDVADAQLTVARAQGLPQLRLNGNYQHVYENARGQAVGSIFNQPNTYSVNANLAQPLFQGGRAVAGWRAASNLRSAARLTERETRNQLSLDVQRAYLDALLAEQLVAIQDTNLALSGARVAQVEQLEKGGRAARYDVLRARVERANLEPLAIQARNTRDLAYVELKGLLNLPPDQPLALASRIDTAAVATMLASYDVATIDTTTVLRSRDAVRAAELTARARRQAIWVARADLLPTVSLSFTTGYGAFPLANTLPSGFGRLETVDCPAGSAAGRVCTQQNGGWFSDRSIGVTVSWPIFDGLRTKGNIDLAQANARLADVQLQQQRERVTLEVARARAELVRARAAWETQQQNVGEAEEAFRLASLRFSRGLGTQLDVSDAQLALLTARTSAARTAYDLYLAVAELARSLGRPVPLPPTTTSGAPSRAP